MPINRAVFSGYAQIAGDRERLRAGFVNVIAVIGAFAVPAGLGIAATAPLLVPLALGPKWLDAIPLIQVLSIYGVLIALQTNTLYVYIALGEPRTASLLNGMHVLLLVPALIFATRTAGAVGAAWACLIVAVLTTPMNLVVLVRRVGLDPRDLLVASWRPLVAAGLMYAMVHEIVGRSDTVLSGAADLWTTATSLAAAVAAGAAVYVVLMAGLWLATGRPRGIETELLDRIASALAARR
jgi:O-antigen/teichoic acid export membrane protein